MVLPWWYGTQYGITVVVWVVCWYAVVEDCRRYGRHAAVPSYAETCLQCPQRQVTTFYCSAAEFRVTLHNSYTVLVLTIGPGLLILLVPAAGP